MTQHYRQNQNGTGQPPYGRRGVRQDDAQPLYLILAVILLAASFWFFRTAALHLAAAAESRAVTASMTQIAAYTGAADDAGSDAHAEAADVRYLHAPDGSRSLSAADWTLENRRTPCTTESSPLLL